SDGSTTVEDNSPSTLLSVAPGKVSASKSNTDTLSLEPMRLYSTIKSAEENLASSLTVSRSILQNNYKDIYFDIDDLDNLESLGLLFLITESKGELFVELNENPVFEGEVTSRDLPIDLPINNLKDEDNILRLYTNSPGINIFSNKYYILQDVQLVEDFLVADTSSSRTFEIEDTVSSATLKYFITCNSDDDGILTILLNSVEIFSDQVFCEYLNERELGLNKDYITDSNTLRFEISEGDYNIEEIDVEVKSKTKDYPEYTFDIDTDLYEEILSGDKEVYLKLSFGDETSDKISTVLINDNSFRFNTEDGSYEKKITPLVDNGANSITLKPEEDFEIDNLKVYYS
ncbi:MAG: hypothetical protein Q8Q35_01065, partial [Nanoarchaeota archaeon]|nr:hypothetical protein [Nanoarchaeota archaeon]